MNKYALISVTDKTGLDIFGKKLIDLGYTILSTGGTAKYLTDCGIENLSVSEFTGQDEILDGRVKTLHPKIHAGILARRDNSSDRSQMDKASFEYIDIVVVNLYQFKKKREEFFSADDKDKLSLAEMIEFIDIGGPTLLRASAKNFSYVYSIVDPEDYELVIDSLNNPEQGIKLRKKLAAKVFATTSSYDLSIANFLGREDLSDPSELSEYSGVMLQKIEDLRYGENPHQKAAWYQEFSGSKKLLEQGLVQIQGKELSYNNINDLTAALQLTLDCNKALKSVPHAVVLKHANPCGVAISNNLQTALTNAINCDPVSAFGGIVSLNREVGEEVAKLLTSSFYEVIIAPSFSAAALEVFSVKKNLRIVSCDFDKFNHSKSVSSSFMLKTVGDSYLLQSKDEVIDDISSFETSVGGELTDQEMLDAQLAWVTVKHVKSNAIVIAKDSCVIGIGAGQMNRLDSTKLAISRASRHGFTTDGAVAASDAFFPFADNIIELSNSGISVIVQPGGSIRDNEVIEEVSKSGIKMILTNRRHFNH